MNYTSFISLLNEATTGYDIVYQTSSCGHSIQETSEGFILVDRDVTEFESIEEAREFIMHEMISENIFREIQNEQYEILSSNNVASLIREHHSDIRVTDSLIESYIELASSKIFSTDPVISSIRDLTKLNRLVETKIDYVLDDGSVVLIDDTTFDLINNIFANHTDVIEYMRESKEHFLDVINQLED